MNEWLTENTNASSNMLHTVCCIGYADMCLSAYTKNDEFHQILLDTLGQFLEESRVRRCTNSYWSPHQRRFGLPAFIPDRPVQASKIGLPILVWAQRLFDKVVYMINTIWHSIARVENNHYFWARMVGYGP